MDAHRAKPGTIVMDLDGVLYLDVEGVPGAGEALASLDAAGFHLLFATNNSTRTPESVAHNLQARTGFAIDPAQVVTSAMATATHLAGKVESAFVIGEPGLVATLEAEGIRASGDWRDVDAVVVGLDRGLTYHKVAGAALAVRAGAAFVATNVDDTYPTPGGLQPGCGAIVAAVAVASGGTPEVCGKPHAPMRRLVGSKVGPGPVWIVGDRPETDLAMGTAEGWTTVLVLTGVTGRDAARSGEPAADAVLDSVADLPLLLFG